ncbi:MAG: hypothetical protein E7032_08480 [Akkermansiaceae bacterium]|nr:hypothetical protein [Akkermansiaceae bacterium]
MKTRFLSLIAAMAATQAFATTVVDPSLASSQPAAGSDPLMESAVSAIQAPASEATGITFDVNVGTQGLGLSVGYEFNKYLKMRVRGAYLEADYEDTWSDVDGKIEYDGNNAGIIFDYHPFGGVFHLSAGVNFSKMTLSANASMDHGVAQGDYELGGYTFTVNSDKASIDGEYDWNDVQPYLGIGWSTDGDGDRSLYFTFDIGVNFIGKGKFNITSIKGIANVTGPNGEDLGAVTDQIAEDAIREEGKDFFKIADDIFVYPVIQLGMGYRF